MTIQEVSTSRIGLEWREEDHAKVCRILAAIEETALGLARRLMDEKEEGNDQKARTLGT